MSAMLLNSSSISATIMPDQIHSLVTAALKTIDKSDTAKGKSQQMLAACINAQFDLDCVTPPTVKDKDGVDCQITMPAFSDLVSGKLTDHAKAYRKLLCARFIGAAPDTKTAKDKDNAKRKKQDYAKQYRMLIDAITLTNALLTAGGGQVSFDITTSLFSFPAAMLLPANHVAIGQLAKAIDAGNYIPLDGRLWRAEDEEGSEVNLNASIAQVVKSHNSRHGIVKQARSNGTQSNSKGAGESTAASEPTIEALVKMLSTMICADKDSVIVRGFVEENMTHLVNIQGYINDAFWVVSKDNPDNRAVA